MNGQSHFSNLLYDLDKQANPNGYNLNGYIKKSSYNLFQESQGPGHPNCRAPVHLFVSSHLCPSSFGY